MTVNKFLLIMVLMPFLCFSQEIKPDVYHILNDNNPKYVYKFSSLKNDAKNKYKKDYLRVSLFKLFNRKDYEDREKLINKDKKNGTYSFFNNYPIIPSHAFEVEKMNKLKISDCQINKLKIINFEWLIKNSWKENNQNIHFNKLFFLLKVDDENTYIKYEVVRTIIAQ